MMKLKSALCLILAVILLLSCFVGCAGTDTPSETTPTQKEENKKDQPIPAVPLSAVTNAKNLGFSAFDNQLVEYLKQSGRANENFTVSPLSYKAALTMAALGAAGETQTKLLKALGYADTEALRAWYATVLAGQDDFARYSGEGMVYRVVNAVWSNENREGKFLPSFLDDIAKTCRAEARSANGGDAMREAINAWVKEQTNGMIPQLLTGNMDFPAILVNALYLKTNWIGEFSKLGDRNFTTRAGETVQKSFMGQTARVRYYADEKTQLVVLPMEGGVSMVFVLGDDADLAEKLSKAQEKLVEITLPMFDVETALDRQELVDYLKLMGCDKMFDEGQADFSAMYSNPIYVYDIIQKAKVHVDENGLEAAAATAIIAVDGCAAPDPETPETFCADRPFTFYVVNGEETPELLFWGQIVK